MLKAKSVDLLNELCKYFANVGANMNKNLNSNDSKLTIHAKCYSQSFVFYEATVEEINSCIDNLNNHSVPGLDLFLFYLHFQKYLKNVCTTKFLHI